jgi:hypothetical protein
MSQTMNDHATKQAIVSAFAGFAGKPLAEAATALFESLGYKSEKRIALKPNTAETFAATFAKDRPLNLDQALLPDWQSADFLFQLTDDEVRAAAGGAQQLLFESKGKWNGATMESCLFFAIALKKPHYTRTELSGITRAVNRLFPMPALLLFRHGETLTLAVINRRLHKRDETRDVLEKVTLIKDIRFANPHRAHVEILFDLSFGALREAHDLSNFVALHAAWQKTLDIQALNKRFFLEVRNWFSWARLHARFPEGATKDADARDSEALNVSKTILNQCNTIFAMRTFDETGKDFLSNYISLKHATKLPTLQERQAVFFGRGSSCENPVMIRLNDRQDFLRLFRPAEPQQPAGAPERAGATGEANTPSPPSTLP